MIDSVKELPDGRINIQSTDAGGMRWSVNYSKSFLEYWSTLKWPETPAPAPKPAARKGRPK